MVSFSRFSPQETEHLRSLVIFVLMSMAPTLCRGVEAVEAGSAESQRKRFEYMQDIYRSFDQQQPPVATQAEQKASCEAAAKKEADMKAKRAEEERKRAVEKELRAQSGHQDLDLFS